MKGLVFLMLVFSLFANVNTDEFGWVFLYKMEFVGGIDQLKAMQYDFFFCAFWIILLTSHVGLFSLIFLTKKKYFGQMIFGVPLTFLISSTLFDFFSIFLLFPFIMIWLVAIVYNLTTKIKIKVKTEILLSMMMLCFLFAVIPIDGGTSFSHFQNDLLTAFSSIKAGKNRLMDIVWLLLLVLDIPLLSVVFFRKKSYFNSVLEWIPACFLALFIVYNYMAFFFLIPFIIIWAIALIKEKQQVIATQELK